jgi:hypothetical protein
MIAELKEVARGAIAGIVLGILIGSITACPKPTPGQPPPTPAKCSGHLLESCAPQVLPLVGECLAATSDVVGCILAITRVVGCATYEILACVVRHEGSAAEHAAQANPADTRDQWRAQRAREFLDRTNATFTAP